MPCHNHGYPVKHTLKECDLIKRYFGGDYKATGKDASSGSAIYEEKGDAYPDSKGCHMIFGGPVAYESKRRQKLTTRVVNAAALGEAVPTFLKWSETVILSVSASSPSKSNFFAIMCRSSYYQLYGSNPR
jgi:hypothetical protein